MGFLPERISNFIGKYRRKKDDVNARKLLSALLNPWAYGRAVVSETNLTSQLYAYKSWVYTAASMNSQSMAQIPLRLYVAKPAKGAKSRFPTKEVDPDIKSHLLSRSHIADIPSVRKAIDIEEVVEHPIIDLFHSMNNFMNEFDLRELKQLHQELTGNAYWLMVNNRLGTPSEIWPIPPDRISPIADPNNFISGYEYKYQMKKVIFKEEQIIHFKMANPRSLYVGMSPLAAVTSAYNINENMGTYENSLFTNMGRLEGAFETEEVLDEDEFNRLKEEIAQAYIGVANAGKVPLLDSGLTYKNYGLKPSELSYIEGRERIKEEILNAFGQNLALYDKTATRANSETAQVMYARRALRPRCYRDEQKLNEKLVPKYDPRLFLAYDDPVPEDQLIAMKIRESNIKTGLSSINEERKKQRKPPFKNADEPLIQMQYVPLSLVLSGQTIRGNKPPNDESNDKPPNDGNSDDSNDDGANGRKPK